MGDLDPSQRIRAQVPGSKTLFQTRTVESSTLEKSLSCSTGLEAFGSKLLNALAAAAFVSVLWPQLPMSVQGPILIFFEIIFAASKWPFSF